MKAAANDALGYTEDQIVSSDVIGIEYGSLFDATQTRVMTVGGKQLVKLLLGTTMKCLTLANWFAPWNSLPAKSKG